jgi:hypothetical protein
MGRRADRQKSGGKKIRLRRLCERLPGTGDFSSAFYLHFDNARWTLNHIISQSRRLLSKLRLDLVAHLIGR